MEAVLNQMKEVNKEMKQTQIGPTSEQKLLTRIVLKLYKVEEKHPETKMSGNKEQENRN